MIHIFCGCLISSTVITTAQANATTRDIHARNASIETSASHFKYFRMHLKAFAFSLPYSTLSRQHLTYIFDTSSWVSYRRISKFIDGTTAETSQLSSPQCVLAYEAKLFMSLRD